jgi:alginate O-acetyltransferase complex protein AlgI
MQFNSLSFIFVFLPVVLSGYLLLRRTRWANFFILLASLYFYGSSAWWYLTPFFFTALLDFVVGQRIEASHDDRYRKRLLIVSVVANLGLLAVFKYTGWLTEDIATALAPLGITAPVIALTLPPAISFYTFQSMSYTIDIYRREFKPYRNVIDYLSFVSFFPHLVAGPIMRARDLLPQLAITRPLPSAAVVSGALFMILFGLFQKTVLADNFGGLVERIQGMLATKAPLAPGMD